MVRCLQDRGQSTQARPLRSSMSALACSRQVNSISGLTVIRKSASRQRRHQILQVSALTISPVGPQDRPHP
jgi:hypothetical protein